MKITEILAIYAALLSTAIFFWNVYKSNPRMKVHMEEGVDEINGEYERGVCISVKNPSSQPIHLSSIFILYRYEKLDCINLIKNIFRYKRLSLNFGWIHSSLSNYKIDDGCPLTLEPRTSHYIFILDEVIEKILDETEEKVLMASVQDQLWRHNYSKKIVWTKPKPLI